MLQYHLIKEVMEEALKHLSLVKEFNTVSADTSRSLHSVRKLSK